MNERIQKLAEQAGMKSPDGFKLTVSHMTTFQLEKFAEMIVRECAQKFAAEPDRPFYGRHVAYEIQKHFGVEE